MQVEASSSSILLMVYGRCGSGHMWANLTIVGYRRYHPLAARRGIVWCFGKSRRRLSCGWAS